MKQNKLTIPLQIFYIIGLIIIVVFAGIRQLTEGGTLQNQSLQFIVSKEAVQPQRGLILDRNGRVIADNQSVFDLYLRYSFDQKEQFEHLQSFLKQELLTDMQMMLSSFTPDVQQDQLLLSGIHQSQLDQLSTFLPENPDFYISHRFIRKYNFPQSFAHITGYTGPVEAQDVHTGYNASDYIGKYRIEALYEQDLKGTPGSELQDSLSTISIPSIQGDSLYLTIDAVWQNTLYELFEQYDATNSAAGGAGVFMDVETGELLALVSYPGFDVNKLVSGISTDEFASIQADRDQPLLDKAIAGAYTPGSIFKIITAYTLLQENIISEFTQYFSNSCVQLGGGYEFCEYGKNFYGTMDLNRAIYKSSNLYFCNYLRELENQEGLLPFIETAEILGIGTPTGIVFENEASGNMDSPENKVVRTGEPWFDGDTCNVAIGQGAVLVSPLQMAVTVSTMTNGGKKVTPQIVSRKVDTATKRTSYETTKINNQVELNQEAINAIFNGMHSVAYDSGSSVYWFLQNLPYNIKAKTGSAETFENINGEFVERTHSWIVGTFHYQGKTYALSFFQQYGGGGYYLTPLLRDFLESL